MLKNQRYWKMFQISATLTIAVTVSCVGEVSSVSNTNHQILNHSGKESATDIPPSDLKNSISFGGVTFEYDKKLASKLTPSIVNEVLLENETDKPDSVEPRHVLFKFNGIHPERDDDWTFPSQISVYRVEEFSEVVAKSPKYVNSVSKEIESLRGIIQQKSSKIKGDIPILRFIDSTPAICSKIHYVNFKNGNGVAYITQFNQEVTLISNQKLLFVFQGFTSDLKFYVLATFPISAKFLPSSQSDKDYKGYRIPEDFYDEHRAINEKDYKEYLSKVQAQLNNTSAEDFSPDLRLIEDMLLTLEVQAKALSE